MSSGPAQRRRPGRPRANRRARVGDPRQEILTVASRLFAEQGVGGTTMSEIAGAAGLQQPSVYYYFSSKEAILEAKGRHDPCVVPRAVPVVESMASLVILDMVLRQEARNAMAQR